MASFLRSSKGVCASTDVSRFLTQKRSFYFAYLNRHHWDLCKVTGKKKKEKKKKERNWKTLTLTYFPTFNDFFRFIPYSYLLFQKNLFTKPQFPSVLKFSFFCNLKLHIRFHNENTHTHKIPTFLGVDSFSKRVCFKPKC